MYVAVVGIVTGFGAVALATRYAVDEPITAAHARHSTLLGLAERELQRRYDGVAARIGALEAERGLGQQQPRAAVDATSETEVEAAPRSAVEMLSDAIDSMSTGDTPVT